MDKNVYSSLKLSYDYLECEEVKLLFLLCSMFPEDFDIPIEDLQVHAFSMGFLHGVDTLVQGRDRITKLVDDLVSSSLLVQHVFDNKYHVKMHDLLRDVAISISPNNEKIRTLSYMVKGNEIWEEKLSGNYTAVHVNIQDLHNTLIPKILIPKVQLLTFCAWNIVKYELVESFFEEMKGLKSLELNCAKMSILPSYLHSFTNVRLLHLLDCTLENIDKIGELKKLEILSFKASSIYQIPTTISQLTKLKVLDLSSCFQLEVIPPNILSRLTKLEELHLDTFDGWEREECYVGRKNASLSELRYLPHLYALSLRIQDTKIIPKQLFSREMNLKKFHITIGRELDPYPTIISSKNLSLNIDSECYLDDWIQTLLKRSEVLCLKGSISTKSLQLRLDDVNSPHLKDLYLCDNLEIKYLIQEETKPLRKILSKLECLQLMNVKNLETIFCGYDREPAFNMLRTIMVKSCNELKNLFFNCTLDDILNFEHVSIEYCEKLEALFVIEDEDSTNQIEFTHLNSLWLQGLPQLQNFCSKIEKAERSTVCNGGSFFSEQVSLPNLEYLEIEGAENLKMIWPNICPKLRKAIPVQVIVMQLESVDIDLGEWKEFLEKAKTIQMQNGSRGFSNLKRLRLLGSLDYKLTQLPMEVIQILHNLTDFEVRSTFIEEIFPTEGLINADEYQNATSMALTKLSLSEMPKLTHVWKESSHNNILSLQSLESLEISRCSQLITLLPSSLSYKSLWHLEVDECHRMTRLLDPSLVRALGELEYLSLSSCKKRTAVIAGGDEEENYEIVFNNLRSLSLSQFSNLTNFCSGKCTIRFPCLDRVFVKDCPEMKVFSQGIVATPSLRTRSIKFSSSFSWCGELKVDSEELLVKDMNTIFRQLWEDDHDVASIQRLFAEENLQEIPYVMTKNNS